MSLQRRRGQTALIHKVITTTDKRGNQVEAPDPNNPYTVRVAAIPQRSGRAEVPGQQQINVVRLLLDPSLTDVDLWSRIEYAGKTWDVVTPPSLHYGSRQVRHLSIDIRERSVP